MVSRITEYLLRKHPEVRELAPGLWSAVDVSRVLGYAPNGDGKQNVSQIVRKLPPGSTDSVVVAGTRTTVLTHMGIAWAVAYAKTPTGLALMIESSIL